MIESKEMDQSTDNPSNNIQDTTDIPSEEVNTSKHWSLEDDDEEDNVSNLVAVPQEDLDEPALPSINISRNQSAESLALAGLPAASSKTEDDVGFESGMIKVTRRKKLRFSTESPSVKTFHDSPQVTASPKPVPSATERKPIVPIVAVPSKQDSNSESKMDEDPDYDPLDAFMSNLYGSGEVETQRDLRFNVNKKPVGVKAVSVPDTQSEDEDEFSFYTGTGKVNPLGTNFITLDQLLAGTGNEQANAAAGWESDVGGNSPADQYGLDTMDEDEKADKERIEFMEAIRKAQEEEDRNEKIRQENLEKSASNETECKATSEGIVYDSFK